MCTFQHNHYYWQCTFSIDEQVSKSHRLHTVDSHFFTAAITVRPTYKVHLSRNRRGLQGDGGNTVHPNFAIVDFADFVPLTFEIRSLSFVCVSLYQSEFIDHDLRVNPHELSPRCPTFLCGRVEMLS